MKHYDDAPLMNCSVAEHSIGIVCDSMNYGQEWEEQDKRLAATTVLTEARFSIQSYRQKMEEGQNRIIEIRKMK